MTNETTSLTDFANAIVQTLTTSAGEPASSDLIQAVTVALFACISWAWSHRPPPNWSRPNWLQQIRAVALESVWESVSRRDARIGSRPEQFLRNRALAAVRQYHRQEYSHGTRHVRAIQVCERDADDGPREDGWPSDWEPTVEPSLELLIAHEFMESLPSSGKHLLKKLFWHGMTESEVAAELGISQPAVNQQKAALLARGRDFFKEV
jgi:DNA-directed RNA polymerase specialized sigma24 family protein